jgi:hypothetical protein
MFGEAINGQFLVSLRFPLVDVAVVQVFSFFSATKHAVSFSLPDVVAAAVDAAFFLLFVSLFFLLVFLLGVVVVVVADVLQRRAEYVLVLQNDGVFDVFYFLSHDAGAAKDLEPINAREFQVAREREPSEGTLVDFASDCPEERPGDPVLELRAKFFGSGRRYSRSRSRSFLTVVVFSISTLRHAVVSG